MGIDINVEGVLRPRGALKKRPGRDPLLTEIADAVRAGVTDPLMARMLRVSTWEHKLSASFHPAGSPLEFTWEPDGRVRAWVKTSSAGPGYHAFVVDRLKDVATRCGIEWDWEAADESDYAVTQDYAELQESMGLFLKQMSALAMNTPGGHDTTVRVNMGITERISLRPFFSASPMGPFSREWWATVAAAGDTELAGYAQEFFPWWQPDIDARFWRNVGMVLLWEDVLWHPPADEDERTFYQFVLDCFAAAHQLDRSLELPLDELRELRELTTREMCEAAPPRPDGIGYQRGMATHRLPNGWTVELPGWCYREDSKEKEQSQFTVETRSVTVSTYELKKELSLSQIDALIEGLPIPEFEGAEELRRDDGVRGRARVGWLPDENGGGFMLSGALYLGHNVCTATIVFNDPEHRNWARSVWSSVACEPSDQDDSPPEPDSHTP